ncbi:hypothetical protein HPB47_010588 [Ixodes persulcatus]|uniref:Uncharacterized protein n=1 Tax=Ixodes persulcatus TaxID=34615 RepID=A0AC60NYQ9_IXOPE|nr:hypothetical protein HPB47_010588 [Ixodes persulcatus]
MVVIPGQETVALDTAEALLQQEVNKQVVELMCNPEWLTQLARHMEQLHHPTRRGDTRQQDTTPDLTFVRYAKDAEWTNTWEDLGSDHYVLKTTIRAGPGKPRGRKCKITEWNKFRELLGEYETEDVTNIGEWMECLLATAERTTKVIPEEADVAAADTKLDCLIRKAYKRALGIPDSTSNEKLAALGLHNTVDEIVEAQRTSQLERLTKSATGRHILEKLGIRYERQMGEKIDVPRRVREKLTIPNLPRHMHPVHHVERRTARAKALRRLLEKEERVYYTDAARYDRDAMAAAMVDKQGKIVASCSVRTTEPEVAEEVAIALALKLQDAKIVVSDSQMAIRQYAKGRISPVTLRVKLTWTPAHSSLPSNEEAHDAARGLTRRARATSDPSIESLTGGDRLVTFRDILNYYAGERMRYPPAHSSLDKRQEVAWRRLQIGTYPSPAQLSRWYPDRYKGACQLCGARATLHHIVWECSRLDRKAQPLLKKIPNQESWEALLLCTDLKVQEQVVRLAEDAAGVQGILAVA